MVYGVLSRSKGVLHATTGTNLLDCPRLAVYHGVHVHLRDLVLHLLEHLRQQEERQSHYYIPKP